MRSPAVLFALAITTASAVSLADPPAPKVCIVVAGDPDAVARSAASRLTTAIAARADLRGVSDSDTRAVLRGEARVDPSLSTLASLRRALTGADADSVQLEAIGQRLGCGLTVEVAARPSGLMLRNFDVVHRAFEPAHMLLAIDATAIDRWILTAARAAVTPDAPALAIAAPPAATPPASTPAIAESGPVVPVVAPATSAAAAATPATVAPSTTATASTVHPAETPAATVPPTAPSVVPVPAPASSSTAAAPPAATAVTAPATSPARDRAPPSSRPDPRISLSNGEIPNDTGGPGIAGWIVAGSAAVTLIAVFLIVQAAAGPSTPPISVMHMGAGASP